MKLKNKIADPYKIKKELALEIVSIYHGRERATELFKRSKIF
jgi:hypothetical protein